MTTDKKKKSYDYFVKAFFPKGWVPVQGKFWKIKNTHAEGILVSSFNLNMLIQVPHHSFQPRAPFPPSLSVFSSPLSPCARSNTTWYQKCRDKLCFQERHFKACSDALVLAGGQWQVARYDSLGGKTRIGPPVITLSKLGMWTALWGMFRDLKRQRQADTWSDGSLRNPK